MQFGVPLSHMRENLVGMAYNGQYVNLHVAEHVRKLIDSHRPVVEIWDYAHRLSLADANCRKSTRWLSNLNEKAQGLLKDHKRGKAKILLQAFREEELNSRLYVLIIFQETGAENNFFISVCHFPKAP